MMDMIRMPEQTNPRVTEGHYLQWVNACIAGYGNKETSSPFEYAGPFAESILIGNLAIRSSVLETAKGERKEDNFTLPKLKWEDRKSTRLNSSHVDISYAVFVLKKKKKE